MVKICDKCKKGLKKRIVPAEVDVFSQIWGEACASDLVEKYEQANLTINYKKTRAIYDLCDDCAKELIKISKKWFNTQNMKGGRA